MVGEKGRFGQPCRGINGRFRTYKMDCVILCITITSCIHLVEENGLRGYSQKMSQIEAGLGFVQKSIRGV
jgi:hypothetical protein